MRIAIAGSTGLVGREVVSAATDAGHEIVELARAKGVDLTAPDRLVERLAGAAAVIDVTQGSSLEENAATEFFTTVSRNLGEAAKAAGVGRTVVLSIIGIEQMPDFGYYVAKVAHEKAATAHAPGVRILRAAQFLDFAGQMLDWNRQGDTVTVPEMKTQPVAVEEIAALLVAMAEGAEPREYLELAGPRVEDLPDLVRRVVAQRGEQVAVDSVVASRGMADGACLPGSDAIIAGPEFATWLEARN